MRSPASSDAESASAGEFLKFFLELKVGRARTLPYFVAAELCTMGAMNTSLIDEDVWSWWTQMATADRYPLMLSALNHLVERELLDPPADDQTYEPGPEVLLRARPELAVVVAARTRPAFVVLQRLGADGDPRFELRMYGIPGRVAGFSGVIAEGRFIARYSAIGHKFMYAVQTRAGCAATLAWTARSKTETISKKGVPRRRQPWIIDIFLPGETPVRHRFEVIGEDGKLAVTHNRGQATVNSARTDEEGLARMIEEVLPGDLP
jgi:hypothetical protein